MIIADENIVQALRDSPETALKWMYDEYYSYVCSIVYRMINDSAKAEDIAQDVFFEIWKKRETIEINTFFKAYLRRAAVNKTLNHIRSKKMDFEQEENAVDIDDGQHSSHQNMEANEMQKRINDSIDQLPEKCRIVFAMSRYENLSYQEISDKLEISRKTVENQISKALKFLRSKLYEESY